MSLADRAAAQLDRARAIRISRGHSPQSPSMRQLDRARANLATIRNGEPSR